jgi:hypothetical protein
MTPTAVLAGFVLAALLSVAINPSRGVSWWTTLSVFLLTISLGALVGALFIYDQLSMPSGFWTDGPQPGWLKQLRDREERRLNKQWNTAYAELQSRSSDLDAFELGSQVEDLLPFSELRLEGPAFSYMIRTHRYLVVPGLVAAALGVTAATADVSVWLAAALIAALVVITIWYVRWRPVLGVD